MRTVDLAAGRSSVVLPCHQVGSSDFGAVERDGFQAMRNALIINKLQVSEPWPADLAHLWTVPRLDVLLIDELVENPHGQWITPINIAAQAVVNPIMNSKEVKNGGSMLLLMTSGAENAATIEHGLPADTNRGDPIQSIQAAAASPCSRRSARNTRQCKDQRRQQSKRKSLDLGELADTDGPGVQVTGETAPNRPFRGSTSSDSSSRSSLGSSSDEGPTRLQGGSSRSGEPLTLNHCQ